MLLDTIQPIEDVSTMSGYVNDATYNLLLMHSNGRITFYLCVNLSCPDHPLLPHCDRLPITWLIHALVQFWVIPEYQLGFGNA